MAHNYSSPLTLLFVFIIIASGSNMFASAKTFTIVNVCKEMVWPGIITHDGNFSGGGFALKPGQSAVYNAPAGWSGRIWARTGCNFNSNGTGMCQTGSCGSNLNCTGPSTPPNTIAEFTVGGDNDFYDVSLVDGFNLPIYVAPINGKGNCSNAGCDRDLRQSCPSELAVKDNGKVIACKSACEMFDSDEYCCRGMYADPGLCKASNYSTSFKQVCPAASSYAFDGSSSIITCSAPEYVVAFCASRNQTVCSYHDNKLNCNTSNTSKGSKAFSQSWWGWMLTLPLIFNSLFKF